MESGEAVISNDQYYEEEEQIDEHGQIVRVVHSQQGIPSNSSYPVRYMSQLPYQQSRVI